MERKVSYYNEVEIQSSRLDTSAHVENIKLKGYTLIENLIDEERSDLFSKKVDAVYASQCNEIGGESNLARLGEIGVARNLLDYDSDFLELVAHEDILFIVSHILGKYFSLMYQSGIVNTPMVKKFPSDWHRDIIHQNFTSSKPLALTCIFCIDDFTKENGGTMVLPFSQKTENAPSEKFQKEEGISIEAKKGSVLLLDSMLFHKTGDNTSKDIRRAVVNVYSLPFINQPFYFSSKILLQLPEEKVPFIAKLLGFTNRSQPDVASYRKGRLV